MANELTARRSRNARHVDNEDGTVTASFSRDLHYEDVPGGEDWLTTDLNFYSSGSEYVSFANQTPVRVFQQGNIWYLEVRDRTAAGKGIRYQIQGTPTVVDNYAQFVFGGVTFRYYSTPDGVKLWASVPSRRGARTYAFSVASMVGGAGDLTVQPDGSLASDAFSLPRAHVEGADGIIYPCGPWTMQGNQVRFVWDDSVMPDEAFPYILDPSTTYPIAVGASDGQAVRSATVYPPTGSTTWSMTGVQVITRKNFSTPNHQVNVGLLAWDTSSLDDSFTPLSANLRCRGLNKTNNNNRNLVGEFYNWTGSAGSDWTATVGSSAFVVDLQSLSETAENTIPILGTAVASISKTGTTRMRVGIGGGQPTLLNNFNFESFEGVTAGAIKPTLDLTYTETPILYSTLQPDGVAAQSGYANATTGSITNVHGDPDVSGGTGFTAS